MAKMNYIVCPNSGRKLHVIAHSPSSMLRVSRLRAWPPSRLLWFAVHRRPASRPLASTSPPILNRPSPARATFPSVTEGPRRERPPRDPAHPWQGARIVVGVAGGIAAYKAAELVRLFDKAGAHVDV